jgi:hypothetical protein
MGSRVGCDFESPSPEVGCGEASSEHTPFLLVRVVHNPLPPLQRAARIPHFGPLSPKRLSGDAQISEASDERVDKLEKSFKPGQQVPGRIVGCVCLPAVHGANCQGRVPSMPARASLARVAVAAFGVRRLDLFVCSERSKRRSLQLAAGPRLTRGARDEPGRPMRASTRRARLTTISNTDQPTKNQTEAASGRRGTSKATLASEPCTAQWGWTVRASGGRCRGDTTTACDGSSPPTPIPQGVSLNQPTNQIKEDRRPSLPDARSAARCRRVFCLPF